MRNQIRESLVSLDLIDDEAVEVFFPSVRDRDDIQVLRCTKSGIIFLSRTDHMDLAHYQAKTTECTIAVGDATVALPVEEDDTLRAAAYRDDIRGRRWLDFGAGAGGLLDLLAADAALAVGIEASAAQRQAIAERGHVVHQSIDELGDERFDVITLFHVFEHLVAPIELLAALRRRLYMGGLVIIEVPHAGDFLIHGLDCEAFKRFTFWSEHLILHTRDSLARFVTEAGCRDVRVEGLQRYSLANHLYWLRHGRPGGHHHWAHLDDDAVRAAYAALLESLGQTDTLIAFAHK